ncbi:hypothetical protein [Mesorhizobium sophorae]|uniref:hypothetical protein n=1 Tax=Mesorhizobium sophorae TaxID=1300294 RepID=UPI00117C9852|nr:hypothetical protein [Mesorhizobium sophorae]
MFFVIRFNAAFAALGINPTLVPADYRELGQTLGKQSGCTPQEAALMVLVNLPADIQRRANPEAVNVWMREGKVRPNPAMHEALSKIGWR